MHEKLLPAPLGPLAWISDRQAEAPMRWAFLAFPRYSSTIESSLRIGCQAHNTWTSMRGVACAKTKLTHSKTNQKPIQTKLNLLRLGLASSSATKPIKTKLNLSTPRCTYPNQPPPIQKQQKPTESLSQQPKPSLTYPEQAKPIKTKLNLARPS